MSDLLKQVFIRANVDGKWESVSLQELLDKGHADLAVDWFKERMVHFVTGISEGELITDKHLENMVNFQDDIGYTVTKWKGGGEN